MSEEATGIVKASLHSGLFTWYCFLLADGFHLAIMLERPVINRTVILTNTSQGGK